jgi:hypothetical protein
MRKMQLLALAARWLGFGDNGDDERCSLARRDENATLPSEAPSPERNSRLDASHESIDIAKLVRVQEDKTHLCQATQFRTRIGRL